MIWKTASRLALIALPLLTAGTAVAATKYFPERQPLCLACHGENGVSPTPNAKGDPERMRRAAAIVAKNRCGNCHGKHFLGGEQMPPLRHQREDYLLKALLDYKAERRLGDRAAMVEVVTPLSDADLADLAHYLAHVRE